MVSNMTDWEAIKRAAMDEDEAKLDQLVSQNVDLDIILDESGDAVLHALARAGNKNGIELLIRKGANVNVHKQCSGVTPLHLAAFFEHAESVQTLIELGADVHARDCSESTSLHLMLIYFDSGCNQSLDILKLLLKHGGPESLVICDQDGDTALHFAAANSDPRLMVELLKFLSTSSVSSGGFEPTPTTSSLLPVINLSDHKGQTPLHHIAIGETSANIENARLSLNVGAVVDARNAQGATPCHYAVGRCNLEAVRLLLDAGANKSIRDLYGATAFHYAARSGCVDLLGMLNEGNVDDRATANQLTALHYAAWNKRNEAVEWLLKNGASVDVIDALKGDTPLHLAARRGDADVIQTLIKMGGANTQRTNEKGMLALGLADDRGHHAAAKAFVKAIREKNRQEWLQDSLLTEHSGNGATLLHYFAAYGAKEDMEWILKMIKRKTTSFHMNRMNSDGRVHQRRVDMCDASNRTAVHWAAMRGNTHTLQVLAENDADLNANANIDAHAENPLAQTPLYFALIMDQKETFANELMQLKSKHPTLHAQDWTSDISRWMKKYYHEDARSEKLRALREGFAKHKYPSNIPDDILFEEIPPIYLALHAERDDLATFIQQHRKGEDDAVNERGRHSGRTALHWAVLLKQRKIVAQLCRKGFKDDLVANVEDKCRKTALQYAKEMGGSKNAQNEVYKDIEKELMQRSDVRSHIDGLYKDRQVYVDAANAILVGAALIAGVTFAGWLQPPLGYASYYNLPKSVDAPAADDVYQTYAAIQHHGGVRWFWVSNALSFSFAIATVVAGLVAVVPIPGVYIATSVAHLHRCLLIAAALLGISIVFVLVAFAAAGFAVLPPLFNYQALMLAATIVGALPCLLLLAWFWRRLAPLLPPWLFTMDVKAMWALVCSFCHHRGAGSHTGRHYTDASGQVTVDLLPSNGNTESSSSASEESTAKDDEDYKLGQDYDKFPWKDGLDVDPTASTS